MMKVAKNLSYYHKIHKNNLPIQNNKPSIKNNKLSIIIKKDKNKGNQRHNLNNNDKKKKGLNI